VRDEIGAPAAESPVAIGAQQRKGDAITSKGVPAAQIPELGQARGRTRKTARLARRRLACPHLRGVGEKGSLKYYKSLGPGLWFSPVGTAGCRKGADPGLPSRMGAAPKQEWLIREDDEDA